MNQNFVPVVETRRNLSELLQERVLWNIVTKN